VTGDIISLAPPFISSEDEVRAMIESLRRTLRAIPAD
jgi:adenosylmethionine-8-amino-7-oxononanoate aminotransferase